MADRVARSWPAGSGEMASRIRDFDWTKTPLGHIEDWSISLKVAVQLMLALEYPTHICVGNEWAQLYNNSYAALIGNRHPAALGQDVRKTFAEMDFAGTLACVFNGETVTQTDQPYPFMRDGVMEPAWFDFSATPVRDETGAVFAILVLHKETTTGVLAGRTRDELAARQSFLLKLGDALRPIGDPGDAQAEAMRVLGQHLGVSRAQYFEVDSTGWFLDARGGYAENALLRAGRIRLDDFGRQPRESYETGRTFVVEDTSDLPISSDERKTYEAAGTRSAVGVPVTKEGKLVAVLGVSHRTPRVWSAEDVAIIEETAERIWAAAERARTEASLRESEARYRTMFETIDEGFCVMELVYGENGRIVDLIFRQINQSFQRQTGLSDVAGRTVQELLPNFQQNWIEVYTKVAETGEPQHQENYVQDVARWYRVHFSLIGAKGSRLVALTFEDISERKRHELHTALLDRVAKDLASLHSPDEIMETVGARVGELFNVSGCIVADVNEKHNEVVIHHGWTKNSAPSLKQTFRLKDYLTKEFARACQSGETFVVRDTTQDERANAENYAALSIGSFVAVPFRWHGEWTGYVALTSTEPRDWRADEVELLEEISRRLFARLERARAESALRASEEKYRTLFETMDQGFADCELVRDAQGRVIDHRHLEINPAFERLIGYSPGTGTGVKGQEIVPGLDRWWIETFDRIIRAGEPERFEHYVPE